MTKYLKIEKFLQFVKGMTIYIVKRKRRYQWIMFIMVLTTPIHMLHAYDVQQVEMDHYIKQTMKYGEIPGLTLVMVSPSGSEIRCYGYSDAERKRKVTPLTTYELGTCSQVFTGLAVAELESDGLIQMDKPISYYLPWFYSEYKGERVDISIRDLLFHTSGIPYHTLSLLRSNRSVNALEQTVKSINGIALESPPGDSYQHASMNYNILGLIIEKVSKRSYEQYMEDNILWRLGMKYSQAGNYHDDPLRSVGYKVSFNKPWPYPSPIYRGNTPAAYITSNGEDIRKWLYLSLGIYKHTYSINIRRTQDIQVGSKNGMGWLEDATYKSIQYTYGRNPNYTTYMAMNIETQQGVAILANSNSVYTKYIGEYVMSELGAYYDKPLIKPQDTMDRIFSHISMVLICIVLIQLLVLGIYMHQMRENKRIQYNYSNHAVKKWLIWIGITYGIYIAIISFILRYLLRTNWRTLALWSPDSCSMSIIILGLVLGMCHIIYAYNYIYPKTYVKVKVLVHQQEEDYISA